METKITCYFEFNKGRYHAKSIQQSKTSFGGKLRTLNNFIKNYFLI